jgi:hypothetical protein
MTLFFKHSKPYQHVCEHKCRPDDHEKHLKQTTWTLLLD